MGVRFTEKQVPEGTTATDGTAFRFCLVPSCDGEPWAEVPDEIDLYRAIKASGARSQIDIARAVRAALMGESR